VNVYLDTSVYDRLEKKLVPHDEAEALSTAVHRGEINVYFGFPGAEELFGQWDNKLTRPATRRRLQIAARLTGDFKWVLKSPNDLLGEAIRAYAAGLPEPWPMVSALTGLQAAALLRWAASEGAENDHIDALIADMLAKVRAVKTKFHEPMKIGEHGWNVARRLVLTWIDPQRPTFENLWRLSAGHWAIEFARKFGLADACRRRGVAGLLEVRSVKMAVGAGVSLAYSAVVKGRRYRRNDAYDLWHAVSASTADIFVTFDADLKEALDRVPVRGFSVLASLGELLDPARSARLR
jgi:hypothetical protein